MVGGPANAGRAHLGSRRVPPLREHERHLERGPCDLIVGLGHRWPPGPRRTVGGFDDHCHRVARIAHSVHSEGEAPRCVPEVADMSQPVGIRRVQRGADRVPDVDAVGPRFHDPCGHEAGQAHRRPVPGDPRRTFRCCRRAASGGVEGSPGGKPTLEKHPLGACLGAQAPPDRHVRRVPLALQHRGDQRGLMGLEGCWVQYGQRRLLVEEAEVAHGIANVESNSGSWRHPLLGSEGSHDRVERRAFGFQVVAEIVGRRHRLPMPRSRRAWRGRRA